jgi:hypothetical protein
MSYPCRSRFLSSGFSHQNLVCENGLHHAKVMLALAQKWIFDVQQPLRNKRQKNRAICVYVYMAFTSMNNLQTHWYGHILPSGYGTLLHTSATPGGTRLHVAQTLYEPQLRFPYSLYLMMCFQLHMSYSIKQKDNNDWWFWRNIERSCGLLTGHMVLLGLPFFQCIKWNMK